MILSLNNNNPIVYSLLKNCLKSNYYNWFKLQISFQKNYDNLIQYIKYNLYK